MDVPSREEFEELQSFVGAIIRYLKIDLLPCDSHTDFSAKVRKAIQNCDAVPSYECHECGASYLESNPQKIQGWK